MTTAIFTTQKPKSFFVKRINELRVRMNNLRHFLQKTQDPNKAKAIEMEIQNTDKAIKRVELDSNFASLDNEI